MTTFAQKNGVTITDFQCTLHSKTAEIDVKKIWEGTKIFVWIVFVGTFEVVFTE